MIKLQNLQQLLFDHDYRAYHGMTGFNCDADAIL